MRKSVKIGKTVYEVKAEEDHISADETTYPLPGYGNNFGTIYTIDLSYSENWAKVTIECYNNTWGTRGHGMTDYWTEATGYMKKAEARKFHEEVIRELEKAENGTPDVKAIFDKIKMKAEDLANEDYY